MGVCSVLEMRLKTEPWQESLIDKKMECARAVYNATLSETMKNYNRIINTREWQDDQKKVRAFYSGRKAGEKIPQEIKDIFNKRQKQYQEALLTKFGIAKIAQKHARYYNKNVSSNMASVGIGAPVWSSIDKFLYGDGKKVKYKRPGELNSLASNGKSGILLKQDEKGYYLYLSNQKAKAKPLKVYLYDTRTDYDRDMISRKILIVRLVRKAYENGYKYYVQLTVDGAPYERTDEKGEPLCKRGEGKVGLVIDGNNVYAVSDKESRMFKLDENFKEYEKAMEEIETRIEYLRRLNNPNNYEENGTIKRGRLTWNKSCEYKRAAKEKKEMTRKRRETLAITQNVVIKEILEMENDIYVEKKSYRTKKENYDPDKSDAEYSVKKIRRKKIQNFAPATFLEKLKTKLGDRGALTEISGFGEYFYYCCDSGKSDEERFKNNKVTLDGRVYNAFSYRAVMLKNMENKKLDVEGVKKDLSIIG